jgi:hypothetical protein
MMRESAVARHLNEEAEPQDMEQSTRRLSSLGMALCVALAAPLSTAAAQPAAAPVAAPVATPRAADGHPDLTGFWTEGGLDVEALLAAGGPPPATGVEIKLPVRNGFFHNLTNDGNMAKRTGSNLPKYKPEFWDQVQHLDLHGNKEDPWLECQPAGVPRLGPPTQIIQTPDKLVFLYQGTINRSEFRLIPTDGRKPNPDLDGTPNGDSVGRWEGDTLVIDTVGFSENTWLAGEGYIHSYDMKVTERLRREGAKLHYDVVVSDPNMLLEPWKPEGKELILSKNPRAGVTEGLFCSERDEEHMVGLQRE